MSWEYFTHVWSNRFDGPGQDCWRCSISSEEWRKRAASGESVDCTKIQKENENA